MRDYIYPAPMCKHWGVMLQGGGSVTSRVFRMAWIGTWLHVHLPTVIISEQMPDTACLDRVIHGIGRQIDATRPSYRTVFNKSFLKLGHIS